MKKLFKKLFKSAFFLWLMCFLAANYIRFVHYTSRRKIIVDEEAKPYVRSEKPFIVAFWHGRLLMMPMLRPKKRGMNVLISTHRDGEMIARTMHRFGFKTIRGSTTRGGALAARQSVRALKAGDNVAVTPDGPKGPPMKLQPGLLILAQMAKVPIISMTFSAARHKRARTWDSFMIPLPFTTIVYRIGTPMFEPTAEAMEKEMLRLTEEADIQAGVITLN